MPPESAPAINPFTSYHRLEKDVTRFLPVFGLV
jgi:hypothetical protein